LNVLTFLSGFPALTMTLIKIVSVKPLGGHKLWFAFSDGSQGERDFSSLVRKDSPVLEPLRDPASFARVFLQRGAPAWPNGLDLAPWAIRDEMAREGTLIRPPHAA
jgi:Protein of unknown function (DUF2442)